MLLLLESSESSVAVDRQAVQGLFHEPSHSFRHLLDRNAAHAVDIIDVHVIGLQAVKGAFQMLPDLWPKVNEIQPDLKIEIRPMKEYLNK